MLPEIPDTKDFFIDEIALSEIDREIESLDKQIRDKSKKGPVSTGFQRGSARMIAAGRDAPMTLSMYMNAVRGTPISLERARQQAEELRFRSKNLEKNLDIIAPSKTEGWKGAKSMLDPAFVGQSVGELIPTVAGLASSALGVGATKAIVEKGASKAFPKYAAAQAAKKKLPESVMKKWGKEAVAVIPGSVALETQSIVSDQEEGEANPSRAVLFGTPAGALEAALPSGLTAKTFGKKSASVAKALKNSRLGRAADTTVGRAAVGALEGALTESPTEAAQTYLEAKGADKEVSAADIASSAFVGALGGGLFGGLSGISEKIEDDKKANGLSKTKPDKTTPPPPPPEPPTQPPTTPIIPDSKFAPDGVSASEAIKPAPEAKQGPLTSDDVIGKQVSRGKVKGTVTAFGASPDGAPMVRVGNRWMPASLFPELIGDQAADQIQPVQPAQPAQPTAEAIKPAIAPKAGKPSLARGDIVIVDQGLEKTTGKVTGVVEIDGKLSVQVQDEDGLVDFFPEQDVVKLDAIDATKTAEAAKAEAAPTVSEEEKAEPQEPLSQEQIKDAIDKVLSDNSISGNELGALADHFGIKLSPKSAIRTKIKKIQFGKGVDAESGSRETLLWTATDLLNAVRDAANRQRMTDLENESIEKSRISYEQQKKEDDERFAATLESIRNNEAVNPLDLQLVDVELGFPSTNGFNPKTRHFTAEAKEKIGPDGYLGNFYNKIRQALLIRDISERAIDVESKPQKQEQSSPVQPEALRQVDPSIEQAKPESVQAKQEADGRETTESATETAKEATQQPAPADTFASNKLFSKDVAEAAISRIKAQMSGTQLNAGFDPQLALDVTIVAGAYIEAGARSFAAYSAKMLDAFGENVRPYLVYAYNAVRDFPGVAESGLADGMDSRESVQQQLKSGREGQDKREAASGLNIDARSSNSPALEQFRQAVTPSGRKVDVEYVVVEADSIITSHNETEDNDLALNPEYDQNLQGRNRERVASIEQVIGIGNNPDIMRAGMSNSVTDGAPIIGPDGMVESGNGRTLGIRRGHRLGKADAYKRGLEGLGFDISGMKAPILVRVRTTPMTTEQRIAFADEGNADEKISKTADEVAAEDARRLLTDDVLALYSDGDFDSAFNRPFVNAVIAKMRPNERNAFLREDGRLSAAGLVRLKNAVLVAAFGSQDFVNALVESGNEDIKVLANALTAIAPHWAKMLSAFRSGTISPKIDITEDLINAVKLVDRARKGTDSVNGLLALEKNTFFGNMISDATEGIVRNIFFKNAKQAINQRSLSDIIRYLRAYTDEAMKTSPNVIPGLGDVVTADEILKVVYKKIEKDTGGQQGAFDLTFTAPKSPRNEPMPSPKPREQKAEPATSGVFAKNKIVTADKVDEAGAILRDAMNRLNTGLDPQVLAAGITMTAAYIEAGVRTFAEYSQAMVSEFGEFVRPYLQAFYDGARSYAGIDTTGMTSAEDVERIVNPKRKTSDPAKIKNILQKAKLEITQTGDAWLVSGDTFKHKEFLKSIGARADKSTGSFKWKFTFDPSAKIAEYLENGAGKTEAEKLDEKDLKQSREEEDAAADERLTSDAAAANVSIGTASLIARGEQFGIPSEIIAEQIQDVGAVKNAYTSGKPVFVIANEAGTGKTFVLGGAIREMRSAGATGFVYVTMNTDLIQQIKKDLSAYGIEDVEFHTYSELSTKPKEIDSSGKVLIFDEAHNIKNLEGGAARAKAASKKIEAAQFTVIASATPFENPVEAAYLGPTGIFKSVGGFNRWAKMYGAASSTKKMINYSTGKRYEVERVWWPGGKAKQKDAAAARAWLFKKGVMTQRQMRIDPSMVDVTFRRGDVDPYWSDLYNKVDSAYEEALSGWTDEDGNPRDAKIYGEISMHRANMLKRILEASKVNMAIDIAREVIADGKNAVIFVETKADRWIGRYRESGVSKGDPLTYREMMSMMENWQAAVAMSKGSAQPKPPFSKAILDIASAMNRAGIEVELPSTSDAIISALGKENVAIYTGAVSPSLASHNKNAFMAGSKPVLVATMAKGGTGLSLHDQVGNRPTVQININLPWKATGVDQVSGRVARYGLKSKAQIQWLFASNIPFESTVLAPRVGSRMRDMGAVVKGIEIKAAETLAGYFDFDGEIDVKTDVDGNMIDVDEADLSDEMSSERMDKAGKQGRQDDTSGDFFPTPYTVAEIMQKILKPVAGASILEPSAGHGNLIESLAGKAKITAIEQRSDNHAILEEKFGNEHDVVHGDFLEWSKENPDAKFDNIIMNPPFSRAKGIGAQDVAHVMAAYEHLKDGGRMVAILGEGPFFRNSAQEQNFRNWLENQAGKVVVVKMPANTFKSSGTGVNTRMVVIQKGKSTSFSEMEMRGSASEVTDRNDIVLNVLEQIGDDPISTRFKLDNDTARAADVAEKIRGEGELKQTLLRILGNTVALDLVDFISAGPFMSQGAYGAFDSAPALIRIAMTSPDKMQTLGHEVIHALLEMGVFSADEWKTLSDAAERAWMARYQIKRRYQSLTAEQQIEEAIAEAFGTFLSGRAVPTGKIAAIVAKLRAILQAIARAITGAGYSTPEELFEAVASGAMRGRTKEIGASGQTRNQQLSDTGNTGTFNQQNTDIRYQIPPPSGVNEANNVANQAWSSAAPGITVVKDYAQASMLWPMAKIKTPTALFAPYPEFAELIEIGKQKEVNISIQTNRLLDKYREAIHGLSKDEFAGLAAALFDGDAQNKVFTEGELRSDFGMNDAQIKSYNAIRTLFGEIGNFVDQHRRKMRPQDLARKQELLGRIQQILVSARVMTDQEFAQLYKERGLLRNRMRKGIGNLVQQQARLDAINERLQQIRINDPAIQARIAKLQSEYDAVETRLQQTSVQRIKGYVPHIFFGSWRVFVRTGADTWKEIMGDDGFHENRRAAVKAAEQYAESNPGAEIRVEPKKMKWPFQHEGTQLSDASFNRFFSHLRKVTGLNGQDLSDVVHEVARKRFRRRIAGFTQKREGYKGFAEDFDRVMRNHIVQAVRYVNLDELKYHAINLEERSGLSQSLRLTPVSRVMQNAIESWLNDVNGSKQATEASIDDMINTWEEYPLRAAGIGGLVGAVVGQSLAGPVFASALGGYLGYRVYKTIQHGGEFKTRYFTGSLLGDMAHLKLGMFTNIGSAIANLSQVLINGYPLLGEKFTIIGYRKAIDALIAMHTGNWKNHPDARILYRHDIRPTTTHAEGVRMFDKEGRLARISMLAFTGAEELNRATVFLGALYKARAQGATEGVAQRYAAMTNLRANFHYGNADKPEILRNVILRVPLQFKNFIAHEIAFTFDLVKRGRGSGDWSEVGRFLLALFLVSGAIGSPVFAALDFTLDYLFGWSPMEAMKEWAIKEQASGELRGTAASVVARGFPAAFGIDVSTRVGLGDKFLPTQGRDFIGPWAGTISNMAAQYSEGAGFVDLLRTASPGLGNPLKALEAAANGGDVTNPWLKGRLEYTATPGELALKSIGIMPLRESLNRDLLQIYASRAEDRQRQAAPYLTRITKAAQNGGDVQAIVLRARENGVMLTPEQVKYAIKVANQSRLERQNVNRQDKEEFQQMQQIINSGKE